LLARPRRELAFGGSPRRCDDGYRHLSRLPSPQELITLCSFTLSAQSCLDLLATEDEVDEYAKTVQQKIKNLNFFKQDAKELFNK
jgi:hypothetical protein